MLLFTRARRDTLTPPWSAQEDPWPSQQEEQEIPSCPQSQGQTRQQKGIIPAGPATAGKLGNQATGTAGEDEAAAELGSIWPAPSLLAQDAADLACASCSKLMDVLHSFHLYSGLVLSSQ